MSKALLFLVVALAGVSIVCAQTHLNMRPIIGILTQPYQSDASPDSYIAASYVKVRVVLLACTRLLPTRAILCLWSREAHVPCREVASIASPTSLALGVTLSGYIFGLF